MLKTITLILFMLTAASVVEPQSVSSSSKFTLGYVEDAAIGCGCSFSYNLSDLRNHKHLLISPMDEDTYITLDGQKLKLQLLAELKGKRKERVGDRSWQIYSGGDVKVRVDYVVTKVCDPNDEDCEATYYRANMTVTRGKQRLVVRGIAICGC